MGERSRRHAFAFNGRRILRLALPCHGFRDRPRHGLSRGETNRVACRHVDGLTGSRISCSSTVKSLLSCFFRSSDLGRVEIRGIIAKTPLRSLREARRIS